MGDAFMIGLVMRGEPRVRMQASQNPSYVLASDENMQKKLSNNTMCYSGYYTKADTAGARVNAACSYSPNTPDIFFSTAYEERVSLNGVTAGGNGSTGGGRYDISGISPCSSVNTRLRSAFFAWASILMSGFRNSLQLPEP